MKRIEAVLKNLAARAVRNLAKRLGNIANATAPVDDAIIATAGRSMALIVFLRGINVGGHRTFRPSVLAKELGAYDVVSVGAAGTLVVRKPGSRVKFLAELRRRLPFELLRRRRFCSGV